MGSENYREKHNPSQKSYSASYDETYESVSSIPQESDDSKIAAYISLIPANRICSILDLGCAEGKLSVKLARAGHRVVASDISEGYLEQARTLAEMNAVSLETVQCDVERDVSVFQGRQFDYIFMMNVIEHLRSPVKGLENLRTLMKPDGMLYIHTPNACSMGNFLANLLNFKKVKSPKPEDVPGLHLQLYDFLSLQLLCHFVGFEIIDVIPTAVEFPKLFKSKLLAKSFPEVGVSLFLGCRMCAPLNPQEVIDFWVSRRGLGKVRIH